MADAAAVTLPLRLPLLLQISHAAAMPLRYAAMPSFAAMPRHYAMAIDYAISFATLPALRDITFTPPLILF